MPWESAQPAIDHKIGTRDVAAFIRSKEQNRSG
jgi:hypothetical protein